MLVAVKIIFMINEFIKVKYDSEKTILQCNECKHEEIEWYNDQPADICPEIGCKGRMVRVLKDFKNENTAIVN